VEIKFVSKEDVRVLKNYLTSDAVILVFPGEAVSAIKKTGIRDGDPVSYDDICNPDIYLDVVEDCNHHIAKHLLSMDEEEE